MSSIRRVLEHNENDSKNTRMDIASAGVLANWRPDELAHISRYCKIAELVMAQAKKNGRPCHLLEVGCGQVWVLRYLYKAWVTRKAEIVASYTGFDIDPAVLSDFWQDGDVVDQKWFQTMTGGNGEIVIQDMTTNPILGSDETKEVIPDETMDVVWSTEVIEHMGREFVEPWIAECSRVLATDGVAYFSTPNHDGSNDKLPEDHVYEWGFEELKSLLSSYFEIESIVGVFGQMPKLRKAQNSGHRMGWPLDFWNLITTRFDPHWQRVILAAPFPEVSNNVAWICRKKS